MALPPIAPASVGSLTHSPRQLPRASRVWQASDVRAWPTVAVERLLRSTRRYDCSWPILLKNSFAVVELSVLEKVDPLDRAQSRANCSGDGLRPPNSLPENRESSFSTELVGLCRSPTSECTRVGDRRRLALARAHHERLTVSISTYATPSTARLSSTRP
jgi:hypothetical protein